MKNVSSFWDDFMPHPSLETSTREVLWESDEFRDEQSFSLQKILEHVPKDVSPEDINIVINTERDYTVYQEDGCNYPYVTTVKIERVFWKPQDQYNKEMEAYEKHERAREEKRKEEALNLQKQLEEQKEKKERQLYRELSKKYGRGKK